MLLSAVWLGLLNTSHAQGLRFGIRAGVGFAKMDYEPTPPPDTFQYDYYAGLWYARESKFRPTFLAGGVLEYDLSKDFLLSSGAQVCIKFARAKVDDYYYNTHDFKMQLLYLQIPLNVQYRTGKFFLGGGGYAGFGLGGKWKDTNTILDPDGTIEIKDGDGIKFGNSFEQKNLRRFDAGLRAEIGFGLKMVRLSVAYEYGLLNNLNSGTDPNNGVYDSKLKHQAITATASYYWLAK